ncbi:MAG: hypothetical protein COU69_01240 [Candidatus Pacebacteria bacterium CG10_big_fil_rev_8_21_14_0_10_56_10]|nr:MAG: hypothetical protein COU69_01240 [Candidatus Pacebacteria bacterium CG10_big_fil_rev_8_21_14_0_10_56_10]
MAHGKRRQKKHPQRNYSLGEGQTDLVVMRDMDMPVFRMSVQTEETALQALEEHRKGKTTEIKDIDEFLADL